MLKFLRQYNKKQIIYAALSIVAVIVIYLVIKQFMVETISPVRGKAIGAVYATGEVQPVYWAKVSPQIAGNITEIKVDDNSAVQKGDVLAVIENNVDKGKLKEIEANLEFLKDDFVRTSILYKQGYASKSALDSAHSKFEAAESSFEAQKASLGYKTITSPITGVILKKNIEVGELADTKAVLFWVGQTTPLRIIASVDEEDIGKIRKGQKVFIKAEAFPNDPLESTVQDIVLLGDPKEKNFEVKIEVPNDSALMIGMTVEVNIITQEKDNALLIPSKYIKDDIVKIKRNGFITEIKVGTGVRGAEFTEIISGINDQDKIVVE